MVKWKDVLDNTWNGPDPVLMRSRGAVCVFPQESDQPLWIPECLTRILAAPIPEQSSNEKEESSGDESMDPGPNVVRGESFSGEDCAQMGGSFSVS